MSAQATLQQLLVLGATLLCVACGSHGSGGTSTAAQGDTPWGSCPGGFRDECRSLLMPLDWGHPDGAKIPVFVSRARSYSSPHRGDLWLVQGGPGASAEVFGTFVDELRARVPGFDIYTIEHRGVGQSARLGCPDQESPSSDQGTNISEAEVPACLAAVQAQWKDGLQYFRLTPAARDLAEAIDRTRTPGVDVFVYGVSYGTSVAIRYLQLRPNDAAGVVLDSVSPPGIKFFSNYSEQYDTVLKKLADLCAKDAACASRLGPDPWTTLSTVTQHVAGSCPDAHLTRTGLSIYAEQLLERDDARVVALALLHRADRCDPPDVAAISAFESASGAMFGGQSARHSQVLYWNVVFSDRWEVPPPSVDEVAARCAPLALCDDDSLDLARIRVEWPSFPEDPLNTQWPITTGSPVLVLNGDLDPQTPVELATQFSQKLASPHQTFVTFPFSAHDTVVQSWSRSPDQVPCGYRIVLDFLQHPQSPDTSCVTDEPPVSFDSTPEQAQTWFATDDLWDNGAPPDGGVDDASSEAAPGDDASSEAAPADDAPSEAAPADDAPSEAAPADAAGASD
jgi:pimeloyl-ACP methyl ester carboxylesterase